MAAAGDGESLRLLGHRGAGEHELPLALDGGRVTPVVEHQHAAAQGFTRSKEMVLGGALLRRASQKADHRRVNFGQQAALDAAFAEKRAHPAHAIRAPVENLFAGPLLPDLIAEVVRIFQRLVEIRPECAADRMDALRHGALLRVCDLIGLVQLFQRGLLERLQRGLLGGIAHEGGGTLGEGAPLGDLRDFAGRGVAAATLPGRIGPVGDERGGPFIHEDGLGPVLDPMLVALDVLLDGREPDVTVEVDGVVIVVRGQVVLIAAGVERVDDVVTAVTHVDAALVQVVLRGS